VLAMVFLQAICCSSRCFLYLRSYWWICSVDRSEWWRQNRT